MNRQLLSVSRAVHVYLSLALLLVLVFFSITGITLNNAAALTAEPEVTLETLEKLPDLPRNEEGQILKSPEFAAFARQQFGIRLEHAMLAYEDGFLIVDYQAPGKVVLLEIDQQTNEATIERTDFGLIAVLNDLHKGRHVDVMFSWLIDISGVILVVFSLAGLVLLFPNKRRLQKVLAYSTAGIAVLGVGYYLMKL
jgi:uncharacterized protein